VPTRAAAAPTRSATAPEDKDEPADLAGSLMRYRRYVDTLGLGPPSLDELLAGPPADPRRARVAPPMPTPATTAVAAAPAAVAPGAIVPITDLCYRGPAALQRAASLRADVDALFAAGVPAAAVRDLVEEVFDLVQLGLDTGA
jgi:hypothetical protein